jgi:hypothetical protein
MLRLRGSVRKRSVSANRILPIATAGLRIAKPIKGECQSVVRDGPDCIPWTHAEEVNAEQVVEGGCPGEPARKRAAAS